MSGNAFQLMSPSFFSLLQAASRLLAIQAGMVAKGQRHALAGGILRIMVNFSIPPSASYSTLTQPLLPSHRREVTDWRGRMARHCRWYCSQVAGAVLLPTPARGAVITTHFCPYSYCTLKEKGNDGGRGESLAWQGEGEGEGEREHFFSLPTLITVWSYVDSRLDQH